ncbi:MAG: MmcQ/YjbR family DNA-binding protein [Clostridia bacterium]|nr:MmcQ/YjbR family DNA-binding protein [Blautia luti]
MPTYHQNKEHWNSVILDGNVPDEVVRRKIGESYELVKGSR